MQSRPAASATNRDLRHLHVLVVHPLSEMAELYSSALKSIGVGAVTKVSDSSGATAVLRVKLFGAVLIDEDLKPMGATTLISQLRKTAGGPNAGTPVILIGTGAHRRTVNDAIRSGATRYLLRPVSARTLSVHLADLVANAVPQKQTFEI